MLPTSKTFKKANTGRREGAKPAVIDVAYAQHHQTV